MDRKFYLDLAQDGIKMPIGADMVLKSKTDHERRLLDGKLLGEVVAETAGKFKTPLAFPLMDLAVEKEWLLTIMGVPHEQIDAHHFAACPSDAEIEKTLSHIESAKAPQTPRMKANCDALRYVAGIPGLIPVGMAIGPFSMMTKLLSDPITAVFMAGSGMGPDDDPDVKLADKALELSLAVILKSIRMQIEAGAKAICVCEPAANKVYISPKQLEEGSDIFDRHVISKNMRVRELLAEFGADLIFHDCGELTAQMVSKYNELDPAILSLGSSRVLWDDAKLVSKSTVLFGNLPTKKFYSDKDLSREQVKELSKTLLSKMRDTGHPFILGSECDVLSVPGASETIMDKLEAMLSVS